VTKSGYTLDGWYKEDGTTKWNFATDTVTANITLKAKWNQNAPGTFTVTFDADGGTPNPPQQSVTSGGTATEPTGVTKTGYTLDGWYNGTATTKWNFTTNTVTGNITLKAKWNLIPFTVTFDADGGTPTPPQQNVTSGAKATAPTGVTRTGYVLDGWYNGDTKWDFNTNTVTASITLKAKWIQQFTVTFVANGGTPAPAQQTVNSGAKLTAPVAMTKAGHTFDAWYKEDTFATQWNFGTDTVSAATTLYAKWNINTYEVTFNADGGDPAPAKQTVEYDGLVEKPADMTKANHTFDGWYKQSAFTAKWNFDTDTVTATTTLYAKWNINEYKVTFDANGGTPTPPEQTVAHDGKVTEPPAMTKTGFIFDGWYKESTFTTRWYFAEDTVTAAITLYANWVQLEEGTITVNFSEFKDEALTLITADPSNGISKSQKQKITVTIGDSFDSYRLYTDGGTSYTTGSGSSFDVNAEDFSVGTHKLSIVVFRGSVPYSKTLTFRVVY
jgi:uncharacterized repeat protein (TIGR02543 family)